MGLGNLTHLCCRLGLFFFAFLFYTVWGRTTDVPPSAESVWPDSDFHQRYHRHEEIWGWVDRVVKHYPNACRVVQIGQSFESRPLLALHIFRGRRHPPPPFGQHDPEGKPAVVATSLVHAQEWLTGAALLYAADWLLRGEDPRAQQALRDAEFWLLFTSNPDGYVFSWEAEANRGWRKTRQTFTRSSPFLSLRDQLTREQWPKNHNWPCQDRGIDLARNYPAGWGVLEEGLAEDDDLTEICGRNYQGVVPLSAPEARHTAKFLRHLADPSLATPGGLHAYLDIHCHAAMVLYPFGYKFARTPPEHRATQEALGRRGAQAMTEATNGATNFTYGSIAETIYQVPGTPVDWVYEELGTVRSFTIELGFGHTELGHQLGHKQPPSAIIPMGRAMARMLALASEPDTTQSSLLDSWKEGLRCYIAILIEYGKQFVNKMDERLFVAAVLILAMFFAFLGRYLCDEWIQKESDLGETSSISV